MYWTNNRAWSPFAELRSLQREMNRLFDGYEGGTAMSRFPALNVWGNSENVIVTAELPGLEVDDLEINVVNNQLSIKGERKGDKPAENAVCHRCERYVVTRPGSEPEPDTREDHHGRQEPDSLLHRRWEHRIPARRGLAPVEIP